MLDARGRPLGGAHAGRPVRRRSRRGSAGRSRGDRDRGGGRARRCRCGRDRGRLPRLCEPGGRGQPERRADGGVAGGLAGVGRRRDRQPALRFRALGGGRCLSRDRCGRRRLVRRGRCRVDEPGAAGDGEAGGGLSARRSDDVRHHAGLALPEPCARGEVPARDDGRDGRERRGRAGGSRARSRTRSHFARSSAGPTPISPTSSSRRAASSATSIRARTRAPRSWRRSSPPSARTERSRPATRAASTTARPRS